jgi:transcriptional regulator with XRE-family HTH domain
MATERSIHIMLLRRCSGIVPSPTAANPGSGYERSDQMTITAKQLMIARGLLGWSRAKLAIESNVGAYIIAGFENATRPLSDTAIEQLSKALEGAGVIFMIGSKSGVTLATEAGMTITGAQVKAARELLGWSQIKLTLASGIDGVAIRGFETGERLPPRSVGLALSRTLKSAGVEFIAVKGGGPGVRLRKAE